jgi:hypothetical protein
VKPLYVVAVRNNDEEFTFYGLWHDAKAAHAFCDRVNTQIEAWSVEHADEHGPISIAAWAYVERVHREKSARRAFEYAVAGEAVSA